MSTYELIQSTKRQIVLLNSKIDGKILRGKSYRAEARRHKVLLSELKRLEHRPWFFHPHAPAFSFLHLL